MSSEQEKNKAKSDAIQKLTIRIEKYQNIYLQPGWTIWALLAALGATIWLLLGQLGYSIPVDQAICVTAILIFGEDLIRQAVPSTTRASRRESKYHRFAFSKDILHSWKYRSLYLVIVYAGIFALMRQTGLSFNELLLIRFYCVFRASAYLLGYIFSLVSFPLRRNSDLNRGKIVLFAVVDVLMNAVGTLGIIVIALHIDFKSGQLLDTIKTAALIFVIYFLLGRVLTLIRSDPVTEQLKQLREDLVFDVVSAEQATNHMELLIEGLKLGDIASSDLANLSSSYHDFNQFLKEISDRIDILQIPSIFEKTELTQEEMATAKMFTDSLDSVKSTFGRLSERMFNSRKKIVWRLAFYGSLDKKNPENAEIESQVEKMIVETDENKTRYMAKLQAVRDAIKRSKSGEKGTR